ncbi:MAG: carboxypeptidase-like regulatory domain-containing protein [Gemmatimonadales bacterium]|jgi:hypothetical protein
MSRTLSKFVPTVVAATFLAAGCGGSDASAPVSPPDAQAVVTGVVTRNDGSPVAGARVQASTRYPEVTVSEEQAKGVLTDEDGRYQINLLARDFPRSYVSGSLAVGQTMQTGFFRDTVLVFVTFDLAEPAAVNTVDVVVDP